MAGFRISLIRSFKANEANDFFQEKRKVFVSGIVALIGVSQDNFHAVLCLSPHTQLHLELTSERH